MRSSTTRKLLIAAAIIVPTVWSLHRVTVHFADAHQAPALDSRDDARAQARDQTAESFRESDGELVFARTFDVGPGGSLTLELADSDVIVETGGSAVEVEVHADARDLEWAREVFQRTRFDASASGSEISIEAEDADVSGSEWARNGGVSFTTVVRIPRRFDLNLATADGDVMVESIEGSVDVRTSDGDVTIEGVRGPELTVRSSDGDLTVGSALVDRADVTTSDGDVHVEEVTGDVSLRSSDGDIWVGLGAITGASVRTSDGDITIQAATTLRAELDLEAEDLSIGEGFVLEGTVTDERVSGSLNGGGPLIEVRTNDGSVRLSSGR